MPRLLIARDGYIYTNGDTFAYTIRLGINDSADNWHEITEVEYEEILKQQEEFMLINEIY